MRYNIRRQRLIVFHACGRRKDRRVSRCCICVRNGLTGKRPVAVNDRAVQRNRQARDRNVAQARTVNCFGGWCAGDSKYGFDNLECADNLARVVALPDYRHASKANVRVFTVTICEIYAMPQCCAVCDLRLRPNGLAGVCHRGQITSHSFCKRLGPNDKRCRTAENLGISFVCHGDVVVSCICRRLCADKRAVFIRVDDGYLSLRRIFRLCGHIAVLPAVHANIQCFALFIREHYREHLCCGIVIFVCRCADTDGNAVRFDLR